MSILPISITYVSLKSFEDYLKVINTTEYWADELAISILEVLFNIKVVIITVPIAGSERVSITIYIYGVNLPITIII